MTGDIGNDLRDDWEDEPRFFDRAGEVTIWSRRLHGDAFRLFELRKLIRRLGSQ